MAKRIVIRGRSLAVSEAGRLQIEHQDALDEMVAAELVGDHSAHTDLARVLAEERLNPEQLKRRVAEIGRRSGEATSIRQVEGCADPAILALAANSYQGGLRAAAAANPHLPAFLLERLSHDSNAWVRGAVASSPNVPDSLIRRLIEETHRHVRAGIAGNPNTPRDLLLRLCTEATQEITVALTQNPALPDQGWEILITHQDLFVRQITAQANAPHWVFDRLKHDYSISSALAWNSNTPPDILMWMATCPDTEPAYALASHGSPRLHAILAQHPDGVVRHRLAKYTHDRELLRQLSESGWFVRMGIAENPWAPPEMLLELAGDPEHSVREAVAKHRGAPPEALMLLASDPTAAVRQQLLHHKERRPQQLYERLIKDSSAHVRAGAAAHVKDPDLLAVAARDRAMIVRRAVANNRHAPPDLLRLLAEDTESTIAQVARNHLHNRFPEHSL